MLKGKYQYIFLCRCIFSVLGAVIDVQIPGSGSATHVHCLSSKDPVIQIKDPFNRSFIHDQKFIAMEWYQYLPAGPHSKSKETLLLNFMPDETNILLGKFTAFEFWGLQINNVSLEDSAIYKAKLIHLSKRQEWFIHIVVATPPVLESETLSVSRDVSKDGHSVRMSCGRIRSLGSPPVSFLWKQTDSGTVLPAVYQDGYLQLNLTSELDTGKYTCDLDFTAPAAKCIVEKDMPRFKRALAQYSKSESADMTGVIAGVAAAVAAVVIIVIIALVVMRRFAKLKVYNAREHEQKRDQENGHGIAASLDKDEEKAYEKTQASLNNGFIPHDLFMVSKDPEGNHSPIFKKTKPQNSPIKDTVYLNGKQTTHNNHIEGKEKQQQGNYYHTNGKQIKEEDPPQTKPRNVFLSPSMEELDKAGKASNGGISNGDYVNRGTLV